MLGLTVGDREECFLVPLKQSLSGASVHSVTCAGGLGCDRTALLTSMIDEHPTVDQTTR